MSELNQLRIKELRELAKEKQVKKYYKMNKVQLLQILTQMQRDAQNACVNVDKEKREKTKYIQPIKKNPVTDAHLELKHLFKKLGRTVRKARGENKYVDDFNGIGVIYRLFKEGENCRLVIERNDLLKTFLVEKVDMWREIYDYLKSYIYQVFEAINLVFHDAGADLIEDQDALPETETEANGEEEEVEIRKAGEMTNEYFLDNQEKKEKKEKEPVKETVKETVKEPVKEESKVQPEEVLSTLPLENESKEINIRETGEIPFSSEDRLICAQKSRPLYPNRRTITISRF